MNLLATARATNARKAHIAPPTLKGGRKKVCVPFNSSVAEDPNRRVFVDLSAFRMDPANTGFLNHPNDQGMKLIADTLYQAMCTYKPAAAISGQ